MKEPRGLKLAKGFKWVVPPFGVIVGLLTAGVATSAGPAWPVLMLLAVIVTALSFGALYAVFSIWEIAERFDWSKRLEAGEHRRRVNE